MENAEKSCKENPMKNRVLEYVTGYFDQYGYAPSYREIGRAVGLYSSSSVHRYIKMLKDEDKLNQIAKHPRAMSAKRDAAMKGRSCGIPQRVRIELADGGILSLDCAVRSLGKELTVVFSGMLDASQIKNGVSRIVACTVEE